MKWTTCITALASCVLLLAACFPTSSGIVNGSQEAEEATAVPVEAATESSTAGQSRTVGERFSLAYPSSLAFYENERPSADGVTAPLEDSIALQGDRFLLTVTTFDIAPGTALADFIEEHIDCFEVDPSGGEETALGGIEARLYADTLCGLNGASYFYAVYGGTGYRLAIESGDSFAALQPDIQPLLDSFQPVEAAPVPEEVTPSGQAAPTEAPATVSPAADETTSVVRDSPLDRGALGLVMLIQAAGSLPDPWQLKPCYEAAGPFCWRREGVLTGSAGMDIKRISDYYEVNDPLRQAAETLPGPGRPLSEAQAAQALQVLAAHAEKNVHEWAVREQVNNPDCFGQQLPVEQATMGPLPAIIYGFACQNSQGEVVSQVLWAEAVDQRQLYLLQSLVSSLPAQEDFDQHAALFSQLAADMPLYDQALLELVPLPRPTTPQEGDFPYDAAFSLEADPPASPGSAGVWGQYLQTDPLSLEEAQAVARKFGFDEPLFVEAHGGLSPAASADLGLFVAFEGTRTLSLAGVPYSYSDAANWNQGPDLPFAEAKPIAEQFLSSNGWLTFPYEMGESDQGEGVLFFPVVDGIPLPAPAFGVRVAANGGVSGMQITPQNGLAALGDYPLLTADMAWPQANFLRAGTPYRVAAPAGEGVSELWPTEHKNVPDPGLSGDFYTNIWAYWPVEGSGEPIIRGSEFFRVTGEPDMLAELAGETDYLVHLWGTVRQSEAGMLELALTGWETVADAGGLPVFFGDIAVDGGQAFLVDSANQRTYLLPDAPAELAEGMYAAVAGLPRENEGREQLLWQKIDVYPPLPEMEAQPTAEPIEAVKINSARLVYLSQRAGEGGLPDFLYVPAWEFAGAADNGAQVTVWVPAIFPEFFTISPLTGE